MNRQRVFRHWVRVWRLHPNRWLSGADWLGQTSRARCFVLCLICLMTPGMFVNAQEAARRGSSAEQSVVHYDLQFARVGRKRLLLDLRLPQGVDNPPLIVWVHGGAWRKGEKSFGRVAWLTDHGYALAGISYRLSQEAVFPAQIHDCKAAVRWLRANAGKYGYDASRIGVAGSSAGGHLAALLGTSGGVDAVEGNLGDHLQVSSDVQAVCDMWGPTDFLQMGGGHNRSTSPESQLVGGPIQQHKDRCAFANPITYVDSSDPPFLLLHGDKDGAVRLVQSELLQAALVEVGVKSKLTVLKGATHGGRGYPVDKMNEMILQFFNEHLKPTSSNIPGDGFSSLYNGKTLDNLASSMPDNVTLMADRYDRWAEDGGVQPCSAIQKERIMRRAQE